MHTLHLPILLLLGVSLCEVLELVASFTTSPSSSKTEFICIFHCVFEFGGFIGSSLWKVSHSPFLVLSLLAFLGVSLHEDLELVVSFKISPISSKSESGCKRYRVFRLRYFLSVIRSVQPTL